MKKRCLLLILAIAISCSFFLTAFAADPVFVESITLNETSVTIPIKKNITLKATIEPKKATNKKIVWTSSDESIVTVKNGKVSAVGVGTAVITATADDGGGASASAEVTVVTPVSKITLSETKIELASDMTYSLQATVEPENANIKDLVWTSSNEKVATVSEKGMIITVSRGKAKITATAADGSKVKAVANVVVSDYDLVFRDRSSTSIELYTSIPGGNNFKISTKNNTVTVDVNSIFMGIMNGRATNSTGFSITPVKSGTDVLTFSLYGSKKTYRICVAPGIFADEEVKDRPYYSEESENTGDDNSEADKDVLFLGIPWGATYSEAADILSASGNKLGGLAQRNDYLRAMLSEEVQFGNRTAYRAAMNFSYQQGSADFHERNSFFKGDLYFDAEQPYEAVRQSVINVFKLDNGIQSGDVCNWQKENVKISLSKKEKYTILEVSQTENNETP